MTMLQTLSVMATEPAHCRAPFDPLYARGAGFGLDGYCAYEKTSVPISDLGFTQADGAYDVVSASRGQFFRLEDHLDRLESSCERFALSNPHDRDETAAILHELVRRAGLKDAYVWFGVTRGAIPPHRIDPGNYQNRFYAYAVPYVSIADDALRLRGLNLLVSDTYVRIPADAVDPLAKNFHWMDLKLSMFEAHARGADWSVLCDSAGFLTEGPGSNIFVIKDGVLLSPDCGCLAGVTRRTCLELGGEIGMEVRLAPVHRSVLESADEAFICSTAGGIMPVTKLDSRPLASGMVGGFTARLHDLYWTKRWDGWRGTPIAYADPSPQAEA